MSKKTSNNTKPDSNDVNVDNATTDASSTDVVTDSANAEVITTDENAGLPVNHFANILLSGKGKKLSPKTENHVFFEIAKHDEDNQLYFRLSSNEGGGLHSKEWILLQSIIELLDQQATNPEVAFKSLVLKPLFTGSSANNVGFLAGALRSKDIGLLKPAEKGVFLHLISSEYETNKGILLALGNDQ